MAEDEEVSGRYRQSCPQSEVLGRLPPERRQPVPRRSFMSPCSSAAKVSSENFFKVFRDARVVECLECEDDERDLRRAIFVRRALPAHKRFAVPRWLHCKVADHVAELRDDLSSEAVEVVTPLFPEGYEQLQGIDTVQSDLQESCRPLAEGPEPRPSDRQSWLLVAVLWGELPRIHQHPPTSFFVVGVVERLPSSAAGWCAPTKPPITPKTVHIGLCLSKNSMSLAILAGLAPTG